MSTKTKPQPAKPKPVIEQILNLVYKHIAVTEAIMEDYAYITEIGMDTELKAANENLKSAVEEFQECDLSELDFKDLLQHVKGHPEFDDNEVFEIVDLSEIDDDKLLNAVDDDVVIDYARSRDKEKGYAVIDLQGSLEKANKLEAFLHEEIYPAYNDQQTFIFL